MAHFKLSADDWWAYENLYLKDPFGVPNQYEILESEAEKMAIKELCVNTEKVSTFLFKLSHKEQKTNKQIEKEAY